MAFVLKNHPPAMPNQQATATCFLFVDSTLCPAWPKRQALIALDRNPFLHETHYAPHPGNSLICSYIGISLARSQPTILPLAAWLWPTGSCWSPTSLTDWQLHGPVLPRGPNCSMVTA